MRKSVLLIFTISFWTKHLFEKMNLNVFKP